MKRSADICHKTLLKGKFNGNYSSHFFPVAADLFREWRTDVFSQIFFHLLT
jgi:hypothetical protein